MSPNMQITMRGLALMLLGYCGLALVGTIIVVVIEKIFGRRK